MRRQHRLLKYGVRAIIFTTRDIASIIEIEAVINNRILAAKWPVAGGDAAIRHRKSKLRLIYNALRWGKLADIHGAYAAVIIASFAPKWYA